MTYDEHKDSTFGIEKRTAANAYRHTLKSQIDTIVIAISIRDAISSKFTKFDSAYYNYYATPLSRSRPDSAISDLVLSD